MRQLLIAGFLLWLTSAAEADCRLESFEGAEYAVCSFDVTETDLRIFWRDEEEEPYRTFSALAEDLTGRGWALEFAMNGGMYGVDLSPVGLLIAEGRELRRANLAEAPAAVRPVPNFYKKPNG